MIEFEICFFISNAFFIAPFIPSSLGVRTNLALKNFNIFRLSTDILEGIVKTSLYPLAAQINASAIPVLPDVGSTIVALGHHNNKLLPHVQKLAEETAHGQAYSNPA